MYQFMILINHAFSIVFKISNPRSQEFLSKGFSFRFCV
uniref:Macaca fascicularis brain cDNA, clone: QflA-21017 n=1 Tax=Macaca fascicularis TaxID=9541 RepID=I7GM67_MACFA|nr:unnamed protein product [Macaca fascicularis]